MGDATFWALVALIIFLAAIVYLKVPGMLIGKSLDERAEKIRNELEEARKLREEAQALLAEYQKKRKEAEKEAGDIVDAAKREAEMITTEAKQKTEEYVARRTALSRAEDRSGRSRRDGRGPRFGCRHGARCRDEDHRRQGQGRYRHGPVQEVTRRGQDADELIRIG